MANELGKPGEFLSAQLPIAITIEPDEKCHEVRTLAAGGTSPRATAAFRVGATLTRSTTIAVTLASWAASVAVSGRISVARAALAIAATRLTLSVAVLWIVTPLFAPSIVALSIFTLSIFAGSPLAAPPSISFAGPAPGPGFTEVLPHRLPLTLIERTAVIFVERIQKALTDEWPSLRFTVTRFLLECLRQSGKRPGHRCKNDRGTKISHSYSTFG